MRWRNVKGLDAAQTQPMMKNKSYDAESLKDEKHEKKVTPLKTEISNSN